MVRHTGLIYKDIFYRLRFVEFYVGLFDTDTNCEFMTFSYIQQYRDNLQILVANITDGELPQMLPFKPYTTKWTLVIDSPDKIGPGALAKAIEPLLNAGLLELIRKGKVSVEFRGNFPLTWKEIFGDMMGPYVSSGKVKEFDPTGLDPKDLEARLERLELW